MRAISRHMLDYRREALRSNRLRTALHTDSARKDGVYVSPTKVDPYPITHIPSKIGQRLMSDVSLKPISWDSIPKEELTPLLHRRIITGDQAMLAQIYLEKGAIVPRHSHPNEQFTYMLEGTLHFWIGDDESKELDLGPGEVLHLPADVPHKAEALEDALTLDIFVPPREDWLSGSDDYLRK